MTVTALWNTFVVMAVLLKAGPEKCGKRVVRISVKAGIHKRSSDSKGVQLVETNLRRALEHADKCRMGTKLRDLNPMHEGVDENAIFHAEQVPG